MPHDKSVSCFVMGFYQQKQFWDLLAALSEKVLPTHANEER